MSLRVVVPKDVVSAIDAVADQAALSRDDTVELAVRAALDGPDGPFAQLWEAYRFGKTQTSRDIAATLAASGVPDVVRGFRLRVPAGAGWPGKSADDPVRIWPAARGTWRLRPAGVGVIVGLHLGRVIAIYRVGGWTRDPESGRHTAIEGRAITEFGRLLDAEDGTDVGPASAVDMAIHSVLTAAPIVVSRGSAQPIIKLSTR